MAYKMDEVVYKMAMGHAGDWTDNYVSMQLLQLLYILKKIANSRPTSQSRLWVCRTGRTSRGHYMVGHTWTELPT